MGPLQTPSTSSDPPAVPDRTLRYHWQMLAGWVLGVVLVATALHLLGAIVPLLPNGPAFQIAKQFSQDVTSLAEHGPMKRLLVVDGGSATTRGLDGKRLQRLLRAQGIHVTVLQLSEIGANHIERSRIYETIRDLLPEHVEEALKEADVTWLREVSLIYDRHPLMQFQRNRYSQRVIGYLDPPTVLDAIHAVVLQPPVEAGDGPPWRIIAMLAHDGLLSGLGVGAVSRLDPVEMLPRVRTYNGLNNPRITLPKRPLDAAIASLSQPPGRPPEIDWIKAVREPRIRRWTADIMDHTVYFAPPIARPADLAYYRAVCAHVADPCIAPDDPALLRSLNHRRFWSDTAHMLRRGSVIFTEWLARRLVEGKVFTQ